MIGFVSCIYIYSIVSRFTAIPVVLFASLLVVYEHYFCTSYLKRRQILSPLMYIIFIRKKYTCRFIQIFRSHVTKSHMILSSLSAQSSPYYRICTPPESPGILFSSWDVLESPGILINSWKMETNKCTSTVP